MTRYIPLLLLLVVFSPIALAQNSPSFSDEIAELQKKRKRAMRKNVFVIMLAAVVVFIGGCFSTKIPQGRFERASQLSSEEAIAVVTRYFGKEWAARPTIKAGMSGSAACNSGVEKSIEVGYADIQIAWSSNPLVTSTPKRGFSHGLMLIGPNTAGFWCGSLYKEEHYFKNIEDRELFIDAMIKLGAKVNVE